MPLPYRASFRFTSSPMSAALLWSASGPRADGLVSLARVGGFAHEALDAQSSRKPRLGWPNVSADNRPGRPVVSHRPTTPALRPCCVETSRFRCCLPAVGLTFHHNARAGHAAELSPEAVFGLLWSRLARIANAAVARPCPLRSTGAPRPEQCFTSRQPSASTTTCLPHSSNRHSPGSLAPVAGAADPTPPICG